MNMAFLAVITPTYNRADLLPRLFESLKHQSDYSFKWYIVDDGSKDNTKEVCKAFNSKDFEIIYLKKQNGGKHTALNFAYGFIQEELAIIVDSDDYLTDDAVKTINLDWLRYSDKAEIAGMSYYKLVQDGHVVGDRFVSDYYISDHIHYIINKKLKGDKAEVFRTSILKNNPFPIFKNERFLSEAVVWTKIALNYKMVYIQKGIYHCEYLSDGLSKAGRYKLIQNPLGYIEHAKAFMSDGVRQIIQFKYMLMYIASSLIARLSFKEMFMDSPRRGKFIICFFPGCLLYEYWKRRYYHLKG